MTELLLRWQRARPHAPTPEILCADAPDLTEPLRERIAAFEAMEGMLGSTVSLAMSPSDATQDCRPADPGRDDVTPRTRTGPASFETPPGYEILAELGRGGMGVVYKALQVRAKRVVALKMILSSGHASRADLERFRIEGESIARLRHANVVQVFEVGEHEGRPFFALEYCENGSLADKLGGNPLPPREAAELVESVAHGIAAAHAKGVVHRDLKPANVLIDAAGQPKVTDFGLAKQISADEEVDSGLTHTGSVMGTPSYMAPEQAWGETRQIGTSSDVYAVGAILYECLTGRPPFKGTSLADTLDQVRKREPVAPGQLVAKVPRDLETICLKCLRKEPAQRYASAEALADDLRRWRAGEPIVARPVGRGERAVKWVRRNRVWRG